MKTTRKFVLILFISLFILACQKEIINFNENLTYGAFVDTRDQHEYKIIEINGQVWMAENLVYREHYYSNEQSLNCVYGPLYTWYTAVEKHSCPEGWHVPIRDEWNDLFTSLGGVEVSAEKMKEIGTSHWEDNSNATNSSGFSALPAGINQEEEGLQERGETAYFWIDNQENDDKNSYVKLSSSKKVEIGSGDYSISLSVRCIKD
jgi:uncharacterized protein (TIGR02145 family)